MIGNDMTHPSGQESTAILEELDLGWHTLLLLSDGSIDLLANEEQTPFLAEHALHLDSDETYRLFISLHEQFKQQNVAHRDSAWNRVKNSHRKKVSFDDIQAGD